MMRLLFILLLLPVFAKAQIRIDAYGDTLKGNVKKVIQYGAFTIIHGAEVYGTNTATKSIYTFDSTTGLELITFYNEQEKEMAKEVIQFDSKGHVLTDNFYTDRDVMYRKRTYKFDTYGRQIEKCDVHYPFRASYLIEYGEVREVINDSAGHCTIYIYDKMGHLAEKIELEISDSRTTTDNLAAYKYDLASRKTEEYVLNLRSCGEEGRYILFYTGGKGYATKTVFKYDSLNRLAACIKYSELKIPNPSQHEKHSGTFIGMKTVYNYRGQSWTATDLTNTLLFREDDGSITTGTTWTHPNWEAKSNETLEYDDHGNVIKKTRYGQLLFERKIEYFQIDISPGSNRK
jgi:hypothetical protein